MTMTYIPPEEARRLWPASSYPPMPPLPDVAVAWREGSKTGAPKWLQPAGLSDELAHELAKADAIRRNPWAHLPTTLRSVTRADGTKERLYTWSVPK